MKVLLLVCDSFGVGAAPDAAAYGDEGSNTLGNTATEVGGIRAPNLGRLGLGMLTEIEGVPPEAGPGTAHGRCRERSAGKDTTTGHWEMAGLIVERAVGRVIARPFTGRPGSFTRTHERRDFSVEPLGETYLDLVHRAGVPVLGVGKIPDIFAGRGLTESAHAESNDHGVDLSLKYLAGEEPRLVMTNLVDFDTKYGHRN